MTPSSITDIQLFRPSSILRIYSGIFISELTSCAFETSSSLNSYSNDHLEVPMSANFLNDFSGAEGLGSKFMFLEFVFCYYTFYPIDLSETYYHFCRFLVFPCHIYLFCLVFPPTRFMTNRTCHVNRGYHLSPLFRFSLEMIIFFSTGVFLLQKLPGTLGTITSAIINKTVLFFFMFIKISDRPTSLHRPPTQTSGPKHISVKTNTLVNILP